MAKTQLDTIGKRIAHARRELGVRLREDISPAGLAKMLNVPASTVGRWEADEREPGAQNLVKLADALGVPLEWLARGGEIEERAPIAWAKRLDDDTEEKPAVQPKKKPHRRAGGS